MTAPRAEDQRGRWGVYDQHTHEWVVTPAHFYERDAWTALLEASAGSLHPWELAVREDVTPAEPEKWATCPECMGTGVCESCDRDCTRCDGHSKVGVDELADHERHRLIRRGYLDGPKQVAA